MDFILIPVFIGIIIVFYILSYYFSEPYNKKHKSDNPMPPFYTSFLNI